jgi:hypothetical protein
MQGGLRSGSSIIGVYSFRTNDIVVVSAMLCRRGESMNSEIHKKILCKKWVEKLLNIQAKEGELRQTIKCRGR